MAKKVFVSWSGDVGRKLAEALKVTILDHSDLDPWVSSEGISAGSAWFQEIEKVAKECEFAIGCMTPGAMKRPWVNFEAGMLYGSLRNFKMLLFNEKPSGPLANLQGIDGTDEKDLERLLEPMIADVERRKRHLKRVLPDWKKAVDEALESRRSEHEIEAVAGRLQEAVVSLGAKPASDNDVLRTIITFSLERLQEDLAKVSDSYYSAQMDYPFHLIHVQKQLKARVRAIALLDDEEKFWQTETGLKILGSVNRKASERVFVVDSQVQLEKHWDTIVKHAKTYRVSVLYYDNLARWFEDQFVRDFSIIETDQSKIVAAYERIDGLTRIKYFSKPERVKDFENAWADIWARAQRIEFSTEEPKLPVVREEVFATQALSRLDHRNVEMSVYVPVDDYDTHEEEHAYYVEMMDEMIRLFRDQFGDEGPYRVLEMGAGTGIFTRRLAALENVEEVVAFEIDWACYHKLSHNLRNVAKVKPLNMDSRRFSPSGRFHAVFSSFADHHIKPQDKRDYFGNVKRNLHDGGLFIVGDEFLRAHSEENKEEQLAALNAYHQHIIDIAKRASHDVLVELETRALESGIHALEGLPDAGDFKVSCSEYERQLRESGFDFKRTKIGPADEKVEREVGGVYVYVAEVARA